MLMRWKCIKYSGLEKEIGFLSAITLKFPSMNGRDRICFFRREGILHSMYASQVVCPLCIIMAQCSSPPFLLSQIWHVICDRVWEYGQLVLCLKVKNLEGLCSHVCCFLPLQITSILDIQDFVKCFSGSVSDNRRFSFLFPHFEVWFILPSPFYIDILID